MADALKLVGVVKRYGAHTAVAGLDLVVPKGSVFGLLGQNGAGKTTTIRMVNDILRPDAGTITLFDALKPGQEAARRIGYLPEERGLYPKMKVREVLTFFGELRGVGAAESTRRAAKWLERLGLATWGEHKVQDLSKGMQQKVQFVTAVLHEPELLILDEPWSGLDPLNAEVLLEIVREEKAKGRTIVFSTHQMEQAERLCDEVAILSKAKLVANGPVAKLKRDAARGLKVAVGFDDAAARAAAAGVLADRALIAKLDETPTHIVVELANKDAARPLLEQLVASGAGLRRFEVLEPSLHEIFVERVTATEEAAA